MYVHVCGGPKVNVSCCCSRSVHLVFVFAFYFDTGHAKLSRLSLNSLCSPARPAWNLSSSCFHILNSGIRFGLASVCLSIPHQPHPTTPHHHPQLPHSLLPGGITRYMQSCVSIYANHSCYKNAVISKLGSTVKENASV